MHASQGKRNGHIADGYHATRPQGSAQTGDDGMSELKHSVLIQYGLAYLGLMGVVTIIVAVLRAVL